MAGGMGERMRASGVGIPKPLVRVAGTTLLEHNARLLLLWGLRDIVVSISAGAGGEQVRRSCAESVQPIVDEAGGDLELLVEQQPLGNIGCAGLLGRRASTVVVVYTDNLTTLNVADVLAAHSASCADLTLACHEQQFQMPYGQLELLGDRVRDYREKPTFNATVASAISVLGAHALRTLPSDSPTGLAQLARRLIDNGRHVVAYRHQEPWVDVNDASGLPVAEGLVSEHRSRVGW
jgi:NDP-sugar pyrophosphorylase family protein